jgi:hypothetical protein
VANFLRVETAGDAIGRPVFVGLAVGTSTMQATSTGGISGSGSLVIGGATDSGIRIQLLRLSGTGAYPDNGSCRDPLDNASWTAADGSMTESDFPAIPAGGFNSRARVFLQRSDMSSQEITDRVTWSVSDPANISNVRFIAGQGGIVTSGSSATTGTRARITATFNALSDTIDVDVVGTALTDIQIRRSSGAAEPVSLAVGTTEELNLIGQFGGSTSTDGTSFCLNDSGTWSSPSSGVVTVTGGAGNPIDGGRLEGISVGGPIILTASFGTLSDTILVNVTGATAVAGTLRIQPSTLALQRDGAGAIQTVADFTDGSTRIAASPTYVSSAPSTASVSGGIVTGNSAGPATISATAFGQTTTMGNSCAVTVSP